MLDSDGYPTEASLGQLRDWPHTDIAGWLEFAQALWYYPEAATVDGGRYRFATGGWSGNEDVIGAMRGNALLWSLTWESSARGGLHLFSLPEDGPPVAQEHEGAEREG